MKRKNITCPNCKSKSFVQEIISIYFFHGEKEEGDDLQIYATEDGKDYNTRFYCYGCHRDSSDLFNEDYIQWE